MIKTGSMVKLVSSAFGWGNFKENQIGFVLGVNDEGVYTVDIPSVGQFLGKECDLEVKDERVIQACSLTKFIDGRKDLINRTLNDHMLLAQTTAKNIKKYQRMLDCITTPDTDVWEMIAQRLEYTRFVDNTLTVVTKDVVVPYTLKNGVTLHVALGKFKVKCNFNDSITLFEGYENNTVVGGRRHPHLSANNIASPCWGTYADTVAQYYKTLNVCALISIILDFLNSCDRHGWYDSILNFYKAQGHALNVCPRCEQDDCQCDDWCNECDQHYDDCRCNMCPDCDRHNDDCECTRCPDSNDRLEHNAFPDMQCACCSNLVRNLDSEQWECWWESDEAYFSCDLNEFTPSDNARNRYRTYSNEKILERTTQ